ncbi:MAG: macro domain-containing protein [Planctomycetaceae bacterium]
MIELQSGDILQANAEALVNTVNCVGIMGRGVALQFRKAFPENFQAYQKICKREELQPGKMFVFNLNTFQNPHYIINFPTKRHWKGKSQLEDIKSGLAALVHEVRNRGIASVAIPPLGCGLGGLDWKVVRPLIETAFESIPEVHTILFEPTGTPSTDVIVKPQKAPKMTAGRAALLALIRQYLNAAMDTGATLLEIHKLMYFMQSAGEPLRLRYVKAPYGPYAENLRHVLNEIEGHFIKGYGDGEDDPEKEIFVVESAVNKATEFLKSHPETLSRFEDVAKLIEGFETPYGMELLSTVDWVRRQESARTVKEAIKLIHSWSERKGRIPNEHIQLAWEALHARSRSKDQTALS